MNILRTRDRLSTTNAEVTAVQRQLEQVQQRFDVGLVAITDVLESQAAYDAALVRQIQAEPTSTSVLKPCAPLPVEITTSWLLCPNSCPS